MSIVVASFKVKNFNMDYKLELHNFSVDGRVTDIEYSEKGKFKRQSLTFKYFNSKLWVWAQVHFECNEDVNIWKLAVTFVKRLK